MSSDPNQDYRPPGYPPAYQPTYQQQYPYPQQYPAPYPVAPYGFNAYPVRRPTNSLATVSLICSLVGVVLFFPASIAGIICGHIARGQIRQTGAGGSGQALAGIIIGYVWVGLLLILFAVLIIVLLAFAHVDQA